MTTLRVLAALAIFTSGLGCGDDDDSEDTFEQSYARAVCERDFRCYPEIARNHNEDVGMCIASRIGEMARRRTALGEACVNATLNMWACQSEATCYAETNGQGCVAPVAVLKDNCPGLTSM